MKNVIFLLNYQLHLKFSILVHYATIALWAPYAVVPSVYCTCIAEAQITTPQYSNACWSKLAQLALPLPGPWVHSPRVWRGTAKVVERESLNCWPIDGPHLGDISWFHDPRHGPPSIDCIISALLKWVQEFLEFKIHHFQAVRIWKMQLKKTSECIGLCVQMCLCILLISYPHLTMVLSKSSSRFAVTLLSTSKKRDAMNKPARYCVASFSCVWQPNSL